MANNGKRVERISISLYPAERELVDRKAEELGVNFSQALRLVIREWNDLQVVLKPQMNNVHVVE